MSGDNNDDLDDIIQEEQQDQAGPGQDQEYIPGPEPQAQTGPKTADLLYQLVLSPLRTLTRSTVTDDEVKALAVVQGQALDLWFPDGFMDSKWFATFAAVGMTVQLVHKHRAGRTASPEPGQDVATDSSGEKFSE